MNKYINKVSSVVCCLSAVVMLGSCGVTKRAKELYSKYDRPDQFSNQNIAAENVTRDAAQYAATSGESFGDVDWHKVFTDPHLQSLIQYALEHNVDLLNATESIKMAEAQLSTARKGYIPTAAFAPSGTETGIVSGAARGNWFESYALPLSASWDAGLWGNLITAKRNAQVGLIAADDYQQVVRSRIICGVANLYYSTLLLDEQLKITKENEKNLKEIVQMMKMQYQLRGAKSTSVEAAESNLLNVQASIVTIKQQIHANENSLSLLVGRAASSISRGTLAQQSLPSSFSTGIPVETLLNRPDVHSSEMALAQCFYGVQSAKQNFLPSLKLSATGTFTNGSGVQVSNPGQMILSFVASLTAPLYQQGKLVAGLKVAEAKYNQAANTYRNSILKAGSEVSDALILYTSSKEKAEIDAKRVEVLKKNVEHTQMLYRMQSGNTYLEVLTAETNLLSAELSKASDEFNKMQAVVNLYNALGGGRK